MTRCVPLSGDLVPALCDFISEMWSIDGPRAELHLGDVYHSLFDAASLVLEASATLWYDSSRLEGIALFPGGAWCDMTVRPETEASPLAEEMIAWATSECRRKKPDARVLRLQRRPSSPRRVDLLERLGFHRMTTGYIALVHRLGALPDRRALLSGFTCRNVTPRDLESRVRAHTEAFPGEPRTVADYEHLMHCAGYRSFLDVVVMDAAQEVAAFCTSWYDESNQCGLFEPVGTRLGYRGLGLARAAMAQGLRRLSSLGARTVVVRVSDKNQPAMVSYTKLGFTVESGAFGFEKELVQPD
jgi:ribosomal protein S18 acetylase RimI-like enzyme